MSFTRVRAPGLWILGSVLAPSEEEIFDDHQSVAVDGRGGGTYAPSARFVFGGPGLRVTGPFTGDDMEGHVTNAKTLWIDSGAQLEVASGGAIALDATAGAPALINVGDGSRLILNADTGNGGSQLVCSGKAFFNDVSHFQDTSRTYIDPDAELHIRGTLGHPGLLLIEDHAQLTVSSGGQVNALSGSTTVVQSGATLNLIAGATVNVDADLLRTGAHIAMAGGAYTTNRVAMGSDASVTIVPETHDVLVIPTLTADRTWTVQVPANATRGIQVAFMASGPGSQAFDLYLRDNVGTLLVKFSQPTGYYGTCILQWIPVLSAWRILAGILSGSTSSAAHA